MAERRGEQHAENGERNDLFTAEECRRFGGKFLQKMMEAGFGTLSKREMEIYIYHLLCDTGAFRGKKNFEVANLLKIPERKVKDLMTGAALKYQPVDRQEALRRIARLFFTYRENNPLVEGEYVVFGMEDPVLKREFESAVKEIGHFVDYSFNREIVKVKAHVFLAVLAKNIGSVETCMVEAVQRDYAGAAAAEAVLNRALSMSQRAEKFLACHSNKVNLLFSALGALGAI